MVAVSHPLPSIPQPVWHGTSLPGILIGVVVAVAATDGVWAVVHHFDIDRAAYLRLALLASALGLGSHFYARVRNSPSIAAMMFGTAFLIAFSAGFSVLNYFLLTVAHTRIDAQLAALDRAMGVNWPVMTSALAPRPFLNALLHVSYDSVLPQVALLVVCLGWRERSERIYEFCLALAIGAAITVAFWTLFPSFGAFSVYDLPQNISSRLHLALDTRYAHDLLQLLANGPGRISPSELKGLIGFPSFHAAMAALVVWYARSVRWLFWPCLAWNALVLVATPIHGGHHVVDVPAGLAVAALAVALTKWTAKSLRACVASGVTAPGLAPGVVQTATSPVSL